MPHVPYHSLALSSSDFSRYVRSMAVNSDMSVVTDPGVSALADLRRRLANAFAPTPSIYWTDLLLSSCVGWGAFVVGAMTPFLSFTYIVTTLVAVIALLRATIFIHELSHLKRGTVPGFESTWNLLVGIPLLLPSLMYDSHGDHHRQATFATVHDPEYAPIAQWSAFRVFRFVGSMVFVPLLLALRWGVLGPLSFLLPPLRRLLIARASSLVINPQYKRPQPREHQHLRWSVQEAATALAFWTAVSAASSGALPLSWLLHWYVVGAGVAVVNQVRTLAAHRYQNDGRQLTAVEQLLDSINLTGPPFLTVLAAPVGLRYHALHHFLPTVPYHSLGKLHRRLLAELAPDSLYHQTEERGIFSAVQTLTRRRVKTPASAMLSADRRVTEV
jgi:fatty acid desaturase